MFIYLQNSNQESLKDYLTLNSITFLAHANTIPILPRAWLTANISLHFLQFEKTNIEKIEENAFNTEQFQNLVELNIMNAPISILSPKSFYGLSNLKILSLSSLKISIIESNAIQYFQKLETFRLHDCGSRLLSLNNLFGKNSERTSADGGKLNHLKVIDIEKCNLGNTITSSTFIKLQNINELRLHSNNIQTIEAGSFDIPLKTLKLIDLESNNLTMIPRNLFKAITHRKIDIFFGMNPWHCDYNLELLRQILQKQIEEQSKRIVCLSPPEFAGKLLASLPPLKMRISLPTFQKADASSGQKADASPVQMKPNAAINNYFFPIETIQKEKIDKVIQDEKIVIDQKPKEEKTITVLCEASNTLRNNVKLAWPFFGQIQADKRGQFINSNISSIEPIFIVFEQIRIKDNQNIVKCKNIIKNVHKARYNLIFEQNRIYRLCIMDKWMKTIKPLNCLVFFLHHEETDMWILLENRTIMISTYILFAISGLTFGILIPVALVTFFPKLIRDIPTVSTVRHIKGEYVKNIKR